MSVNEWPSQRAGKLAIVGHMASSAETPRPRKLVVAGMIIDGDTILISQRTAQQSLAHQWEFPGGKMEEGEGPEQALIRELREELGVTVVVGTIWEVLSVSYPGFELLMLVYPCRLAANSGRPQCVEVADFRWVTPGQMGEYDILTADAPLVQRLVIEGIPVGNPPIVE